ncbi:hypothetical protein EJ08DRAFT_683962 [Tothia fuscella]|uniref:Uncharacterized protein n=1 Tax=Tothia fuscella TaxID=1048955 RepID=A0A9P4TSY1_9PEZI|nr:hypothetical protein EJ08DRAFT_683962 [Tothia fuscella]
MSTSPDSIPSPTARSFFNAITERVRGRSRSRSPAPITRNSQISPPETRVPIQSESTDRPQAGRSFSSSTTIVGPGSPVERTASTGGADRSQFDSMAYGRHSSEWLFKSQKTLKRQNTSGSTAS